MCHCVTLRVLAWCEEPERWKEGSNKIKKGGERASHYSSLLILFCSGFFFPFYFFFSGLRKETVRPGRIHRYIKRHCFCFCFCPAWIHGLETAPVGGVSLWRYNFLRKRDQVVRGRRTELFSFLFHYIPGYGSSQTDHHHSCPGVSLIGFFLSPFLFILVYRFLYPRKRRGGEKG